MLLVGSRDGREGLGFGVGEEMEEAELEEGEAYSYRDDDGNVDDDADIALSSLSYIDEKIQHVLGHFQKDFEGGVSAENLGAKFGGYGSFLPSYQRSPSIWSHPRSPQKVQTYSTPKSPNNLPLEGGQNRPVLESGTHSDRHAFDSTNALFNSTTPYMDNQSKKGPSPKHEVVNNGSVSVSATDQKMLKLRIKVGSNNVSARKNAAIYSGLGLISPSSSLEDSPDGSGSLSPESHVLSESPMTILQNMTSFPVPGESLLSPLADYLLHITEKERPIKDNKPGTVLKGNQAIPTMLADTSLPVRDLQGFGVKKTMSAEKNGRPMEVQSTNGKDSEHDMSDHLKREIDIETPAGRELVSNALKLPLLFSSKGITERLERPITTDIVGGSYRVSNLCQEVNKDSVKDCTFSSDLVKEEVCESMTTFDPSKVCKLGNASVLLKEKLNLKLNLTDKVLEEMKASSQKDISFDPRKDGRGKGEKNFGACKVDSDGFNNSGSLEPSEQKTNQKSTSYEQNVRKTSKVKEGKKKMKGNQSNGVDFSEECSRAISSVDLNDKKSSQARDNFFENRSDDMKSRKETSKTINRECHRDSLGGTKVQQVDNRTDMSFKDMLKESKLDSVKETHTFAEKSKERSGAKKGENPSTSEAYVNAPAAAPLAVNGPTTDAVIAQAVPVVIEENWVCCDKCQKWRLLPYETDPDLFLGKKWLCSMLDWLPGMNKCTFSEEETTKALNALYQIPVPESQNSVQGQYNGATSGNPLADVQYPHQSHEHGSLAMSSTGRKRHGPKDTSNVIGDTTLTHPSNSIKRNQESSIKSRSSNDANQHLLESNLVNKVTFPDTNKSTDFAMEKHSRKRKEKHKLLVSHSDGGDYIQQSRKQSKTKSKREADHDNGFTTSKKIKTEGLHSTNADWQSDCDVTRKEIPNSSNDSGTKVTGKDPQKHNGYISSKDLKGDTRDNSLSSRKKTKVQHQVPLDGEYKTQFGVSDMGRSDRTDFAAKKRKLKEWEHSQGYPETLLNSAPVPVKDEIGERELQSENKARSSKSKGKEFSASKADGRIEKKGGATKILLPGSKHPLADGMEEEIRGGNRNQGNSVSHRTRDAIDLLRREPGFAAQTSTAATSSSSKVSGSRKSKRSLLEPKGSPVESVSSSPLRRSNTDKLTTAARRNILGKDDATDRCFSVAGSSPKNCLDGEGDGGSGRVGAVRKEKASTVQHGMSCEDGRSDLFQPDRTDREEMASGRGKSQSFPPGDKQESEGQCSPAMPTHHKGSRPDVYASSDDAMRVPKQPNGAHHSIVSKSTPNGTVGQDLDGPSLLQAAAKVLKEAKDLKHSANRLKRGGGELESTNLYFQAALKFLHGASLLERCSADSAKNGETTQSMKYYTDTASLCEFCAHEYEKCKEMAAAALAYKCVEVAYMRVIYYKHPCARSDQIKLQKALQTVPPGESPSSSASDVDDLNNQSTSDKVALGKSINIPHTAGNHVILACNRANYTRMLNYVHDMNSAMEASRKSQNAFAVANVSLKEARYRPEDISTVRSVLVFNFHDVEELIHLVRLAMEAICC